MKRDFLEEDMYELIHDHFQELGYSVHGEVRSCDMTAVKDDTLVILELKKSLSMELLIQAVKRQRLGDLTFICVPKPKNYAKNRKFKDVLYLLKRLSLGLIFCDPQQNLLEVILDPQEFDMAKSKRAYQKRRTQLIHEIQGRTTSLNKGGSRGKKLMTAYREDAIRLLWLSEGQELIAPVDGVRCGISKAPGILRDNHYGWFEKVSRGKYALTPMGRAALTEYADILPLLTKDLVRQIAELSQAGPDLPTV